MFSKLVFRRSFVSSTRSCAWDVAKTNDGRALVVTMNSNPVNCINTQFNNEFADALTVMERERLPVVLTSASLKTFCAGLDLRWIVGGAILFLFFVVCVVLSLRFV